MHGDEVSTASLPDQTDWGVTLCLFLLLVLLVSGCQKPTPPPPKLSDAEVLARAKTALSEKQYVRAEELASSLSGSASHGLAALSIAGEAAVKEGRHAAAIQHYLSLAQLQQQAGEAPLGLFFAGEAARDAGRLTEAEHYYRQFLEFAPSHLLSHARLALFASLTARRKEALEHYFFLIRSGKAELNELVLFADQDRPIEQRPFLEDCRQKSPEDLSVRLGLAAHDVWEGDIVRAFPQLQAIVQADPANLSAQTLWGELLLNRTDREFVAWHRSLPASAEADADLHYIRGLWARKHNQPEMAARCFWQAIQQAPTHRKAMFQLGQVLRSLGHPASEMVESRSRQLIQLTQLIDTAMRTKSQVPEPFRETVVLLEQMGRLWEAAAWGLAARNLFPDASWPQELLTRIAPHLRGDLPQVIDRENLGKRLDLSSYPAFRLEEPQQPDATSNPPELMAKIQFEELAHALDFVYDNGNDPATPGARIFEQTGGGVAVLDYDRDQWPDAFFPQGGTWQTGRNVPEPPGEQIDRLYRNLDGGRPLDVTIAAGLVDRGFGQGATVGDFDNDGFPDLYVANIGRNQLLRNNGDGTFTDVTEAAGLTMTDWTVSCAIVDLNADGHPDLFDVNYVTGPQVYERICQGKACSPSVYDGASDRVWINHGDGHFDLLEPLAPEVDGKGLGIVAWVLDDPQRPNLLVANDQVPNFLLRNRSANNPANLRLDEEAFISGVAFNQDGLAMASMGIASDDFDGDGRLDFYITTFKDENSLLLLQDSPGLFVDRATTAGLAAATWPLVGWGTQSIDADADGWPDLIAVNGHVDDYRDQGGEFAMRPQFFRNLGNARFEEWRADRLGPFFDEKRSGRGLSRVDWNRDGRPDFVASNMGDPASLVLNTTQQPGNFLTVSCVAVHSAREAIGATVEVHAKSQRWRKQLTAGDGYMASNERTLNFGLGKADRVDELIVEWPSGARTMARDVPVNATLEIMEGRSHAIVRTGIDAARSVHVTPTSAEVP